jgi:autotransporter-associated beta strand protein
MKLKITIFTSALALAASSSGLLAQSVWNGGAGNWSSNATGGWNNTGVPNAIGATANINGIATGTITVDGTYTLGTLTSAATRNLTGGTLIFDVVSGNALFDFTNSAASGGSGTIGGFSTYSTNLTLNDNTEFRGLISTSSAAPIFTGKISGTGAMLLTNIAGTPSGGSLRVDLRNSTNDFSGGINVGNGTALRLNASGAAGSGTITLADTTSGGNNLDFRVDASNATQVHSNNINFGTRTSGSATIMSLVNNTMNVTLNGVLSGKMGSTGRINLNGGTLVLGGVSANTWTEQIRTDTSGVIIADKASAISNGMQLRGSAHNGNVTSLLFGVSDTNTGAMTLDGNASGSGFAYMAQLGLKNGNNGTVTLNSSTAINLNNAYGVGGTDPAPTTSLNLHSGNGTGTLNVTTQITETSGGNVRNISVTGSGTVNLNRASGNNYEGTTTVSGGTLLVSNTSGSATGSGAVNVSSGATLGGNGTISGTTSIKDGGIHASAATLGTAADVQKFTGNLTYEDASIFSWEIAKTNASSQTRGVDYDAVNVTGTLAGLDGVDANGTTDAIFRIVIGDSDFSDAFWNTTRTWGDIFTAADGTTDKTDWASIFGGGFQYYKTDGTLLGTPTAEGSFSFADSGTSLKWTAVPEPTSALAGILLTAGLLRRRRSA